ncbi:type I glutamate--ammonia ligase [Candidatus Dependentiae bacterium]|nr:type I glutamate--ammonia ligase [Candidatus Dependentiae bacterium]
MSLKFHRVAKAFLFLSLNISFPALCSQTTESILKHLRDQKVSFVMFSFCDLLGNLKEVTLPLDQVKNALADGLMFDGSSINGYSSITESDLLLKADISTLRILPWTTEDTKTAWLIANIYKNKTERYEADPRYILERACQELADLGYQLNVGPELEFFLFQRDKDGNPTASASDAKKYFDPETNNKKHQEKQLIIKDLKLLGVGVEKLHHEVASGQHEISIKYGNALALADQLIVAKHALTVRAQDIGLHASFMPKPHRNQNGSGMHIHFSLYDTTTKRNVFYSEQESTHLSPVAQSFIAGVLESIKQFSSLLNPTINSYKRLVPGYEAPIYICWGNKNRSTLIRIPEIHADASEGTRAEIRCPDATCNPYLACAALIKAGLDGIKNNKQLAPAIPDNLYKLTPEALKERAIESLPTSLTQALDELEKSTLAQELLGQKAWHEYLLLKRKECQEFDRAVTDWERENYL